MARDDGPFPAAGDGQRSVPELVAPAPDERDVRPQPLGKKTAAAAWERTVSAAWITNGPGHPGKRRSRTSGDQPESGATRRCAILGGMDIEQDNTERKTGDSGMSSSCRTSAISGTGESGDTGTNGSTSSARSAAGNAGLDNDVADIVSPCKPVPAGAASRPIVGRFAPTPSGRMHLGNVTSCLVAWLSARAAGGRMVLRIEDLDPRAQSREAARLIMGDLAWLGLDWDEGPYWQSERGEVYAAAIESLGKRGLTYPCFCTRSELHAATAPHASDGTYVYAGTCRGLSPREVARRSETRPPATRLRVPEAIDPASTIAFTDLAFGATEENLARECGDFLVRRSDGVVAYQLAVVVDDAEMGVTQVVRGRDLLGSAARQIYLASLLGHEAPSFGHVPLLVAPDGRRLSKREHDLDMGALRERYTSPKPLLGVIGSHLGLCEQGEEPNADALIERFSWGTIAANRSDIIVDEGFLPE